jgi:IS4 transposase
VHPRQQPKAVIVEHQVQIALTLGTRPANEAIPVGERPSAGAKAQADYPDLLRRIVAWDAENEREIVLLTNQMEFGATTIAAIYKERWQIELFFKALKQNLTVKTFVGTSENALRIQIWTALIALLLLKWLHHLSKANWSLSNLASMLRLNLFTYRELTQWIDNPMGTPPLIPVAEQLTLALV